MKISPLPAVGMMPNTLDARGMPQASSVQQMRALKMSTQATPGAAVAELSIPDTIDPAAPEATEPLSPQLAAIAKQRRALQVKEREIADREKALLTQSSTQGAAVDMARLKSNPLGVLLESGVTFEQLTQAVLSHQENSPVLALEAKIKALEEGVDKKLTDRDAQAEQQVLAEMRREALQLVAQGDTFEMVRETRNVPQVMKLIERTYRETGEVLDVKAALGLVEDELIKDSLRLAGISKVQSRLAPKPAPPPAPQQRQMRTLTNRDTASVPMGRRERALAAALGTLRK